MVKKCTLIASQKGTACLHKRKDETTNFKRTQNIKVGNG